MAIYRTDWHAVTSYAPTRTFDIILPSPTRIGSQVSLYARSGGGASTVGIKSIRRRNASGSDETIDFGHWLQWPAVRFEDKLISITFAIGNGANQGAGILARMDFFD
ncbi:hypothetical protein CPJCM30710_27620 [Clostridium polyendosporum]|uniref:Uncharacterized protein n=1 Tax=Clostridium polyendosporum TaxID=69208 RepID=A0A919S190_9CLOT|nr:hypothetical protein [Clostridium polyendosporum]GIM30096.1 hypothetical protein CPJCM30710_27620 [Clostridium polyendosporum]